MKFDGHAFSEVGSNATMFHPLGSAPMHAPGGSEHGAGGPGSSTTSGALTSTLASSAPPSNDTRLPVSSSAHAAHRTKRKPKLRTAKEYQKKIRFSDMESTA